ncbi:acetylpolyamine aminohydrolase [Atractiella rhizophila]|nr:acetylpolyamine aminohydrolase [Atractiella rhizophila]
MLVFYSPLCLLHNPPCEFLSSRLHPYMESPDRIKAILDALTLRSTVSFTFHKLSDQEVEERRSDVVELLGNVHSEQYLAWLENGWGEAKDKGLVADGDSFFPETFLHQKLMTEHGGRFRLHMLSPIAKAGLFSFDLSAPLTEDTWKSAFASAVCAHQAALSLLSPDSPGSAFALIRPPGHHAATQLMGGYCFINNACLAYYALRKASPDCKVGIVDIDYHGGNGTMSVLEGEEDVFYLSLNGEGDYPYFTNLPGETEDGRRINIALPQGTTDADYLHNLSWGLEKLSAFSPDFIIVSLGVDTAASDPIQDVVYLSQDCYPQIGQQIKGLGKKTVFLMEGGYDLKSIGDSVRGVLEGFIRA